MAELLNYFDAGTPQDVVQRTIEELKRGHLVGLPFDTRYAVCGIATNAQVAVTVGAIEPQGSWALACSDVDAAVKSLSALSQLQFRLASRLWPGPALLRFHDVAAGAGLDSVPAAVISLVTTQGALQIVVPESPLCRQVLQSLPGPVLTAVSGDHHTAADAAELFRRSGTQTDLVVDAGPTLRRYPLTIVDVARDSWNILRPGAVPEKTVAEAACLQVLFVCTGNTCRSPMAERLFRKLLSEKLNCEEADLTSRGVVVRSAGLAAFDGAPASVEAVELLRELGIDLDDHQSRRATASLLLHADYVVTMTRMHRETILQQYPQLGDRVRTVAQDGTDVSDPFGEGIDEYRRCRDQLERNLDTFASRLISEVAGGSSS